MKKILCFLCNVLFIASVAMTNSFAADFVNPCSDRPDFPQGGIPPLLPFCSNTKPCLYSLSPSALKKMVAIFLKKHVLPNQGTINNRIVGINFENDDQNLKGVALGQCQWLHDGRTRAEARYFAPPQHIDVAHFFGSITCDNPKTASDIYYTIHEVVRSMSGSLELVKSSVKDPVTQAQGRQRPYQFDGSNGTPSLQAIETALTKTADSICSSSNLQRLRSADKPSDKDDVFCAKERDNTSFPSFHAAASEVMADLLKMLFPELHKQFERRAQEIRSSRIVLAVHHPFDVNAGKDFADLFVKEKMKCNGPVLCLSDKVRRLKADIRRDHCSILLVQPKNLKIVQDEERKSQFK